MAAAREGFLTDEQREVLKTATQSTEVLSLSPKSPSLLMAEHQIKAPAGERAGKAVDFIDLDLSRFIAAGKLHCTIDKVDGVLETNRSNAMNALYQAIIKQGDLLLNRNQKLSCAIDL